MENRYSKKREAILQTLKQASGALSVNEIRTALPAVDVTTIYRNLDKFVQAGTVKKLLLASGEAYFEYQHEPHHHAVCTECKKVIHFTAPDAKLKKLLPLTDFDITDFEVTVRGVCKHGK